MAISQTSSDILQPIHDRLTAEHGWRRYTVDALVERWEHIKTLLVEGYEDFGLDDLENHLSARTILAAILTASSGPAHDELEEAVATIDREVKAATQLWNPTSSEGEWWEHRIPVHPNPDLLEELILRRRYK